jgi:hypothetical protein
MGWRRLRTDPWRDALARTAKRCDERRTLRRDGSLEQRLSRGHRKSLVENLGSKKDYATLGIYSEDSGHAITPYKIEEVGPKAYRVYVYDNNHPGEEKFVEIDAGKNHWKYALAAINPKEDPSPWEGGAGSMDVTLLSSRYASWACPSCGDHAAPRSPKPANGPQSPRAPSANSDYITLETPARCSQIVVTGKKDKKQFSVGKNKKNEIKGASISNVALSQGSTQTFSIGTDMFTFQAGGSQKPTLRIANERADSLGYYEIKDLSLNDGYEFSVEEGADGKLSFSDNDPNLDSYDLKVEDIQEDGTKSYDYDDVETTDDGEQG